jgi:hypothetical protein
MKVSRAAFLKACGAALLGVGVDASALLDTSVQQSRSTTPAPAGAGLQMASAGAERFRQQLKTSFAVHSADGTRVRLVLAKVLESPITRNVEQFSLIFHAPAGTGMPHGTYAFQHDALGHFDLFIVPIGAPNEVRSLYQACFSRHLSPSEVACRQATIAVVSRRA